jgi:hypothetical protein
LDGSGSFDPNEGEHESGCPTCPDDTITAWDWDLTPPLTGFDDESGEIVTLNSSEIAIYFGAGAHNVGLKVADKTALSYPSSGEPNLTDADFTTVEVYEGCICDLTANVGCGTVELSWPDIGADSYVIYESTEGANTGFAEVVTASDTSATVDIAIGGTVYYRVMAITGTERCLSNALEVYGDPALCETELWAVEYRWGDPPPGYSFANWPIFVGWPNVRIENRGTGDAFNVTAELMICPDNTTVTDPFVTVGDIPTGGSAWSIDTYTTEVDMADPGDPCEECFWRIEYDDGAGFHHVIEGVPEFPPGEGPPPCP